MALSHTKQINIASVAVANTTSQIFFLVVIVIYIIGSFAPHVRLELTSSVSLSLRTLDGLCCLLHQWGITVSKLSERLCSCCRILASRLRLLVTVWASAHVNSFFILL